MLDEEMMESVAEDRSSEHVAEQGSLLNDQKVHHQEQVSQEPVKDLG
ncbi:hypothetical protein AGMMS49950_07670 [Endomicrobiia bacterium]|nr:hypothetical protein AGMMS49950_07670 [Endomicrobiia bacterium]